MAARTPPRRGAPIRGALLGALLALAALLWPAAVRAAEAAPPFPASPTSQADLALVGGTVLTVTRGTIERGTVLVRGGRIAAVGRELPVPPGARTIDCTGRYLMPGIIDTHSHMGVYPWTIARGNADGNEATQPLTPHVRAADSIYLEDPAFERARAGGVTAVLVIPGSANLIGGEGVVLKLRPGGTLAAMRLEGAPRQLKMAMGENPKRVYGSRGEMPSTRMGNLAYLREAFARARTYRARWREFEQARAAAAARNEPLGLLRPDYDAELELLAQVLEGELRLQVHCYTRSDILALLRLADEVGLEIAALHHAVEAYKVAPELARRGIGVCTWADWWGFKQEAWDAIPENAAICARAGVTVAIHSDSSAQVQKLYLEAAKTIAHGMSPEAALAAITIGPARILGIDDRVGSIEPGKDADLAVFSGHPFTAAARVELTLIDGEVVYDRAAAEAKGPPLPPPLPEPAHVVIRGARVLPVAGAPIDNGVIEIAGGRIVAVGGPATPVSPQARAIEARGRTVFPGLIDAFSHVGLVEVGSDPALRETDAIGGLMLPHLRVTDGLLPDSETVRVARAAGVTTCLLAPEEHNAIAGMAAVVDLLGGTVEDMVVLDPAALCLNLGTSPVAFGRERRELGTRMELVARLRAYLVEAEEYGARWERHARERARYNERFGRWLRERARRKLWGWLAPPGAGEARRRSRDGDGGEDAAGEEDRDPGLPPAPPARRLELEALQPVLRGELPVLVRAHTERDIRQALALCEEFGLRPILNHGTEAYRVADLLAARGVPLVLGPVTTQPSGAETWGAIYENAALLQAAGVRFALQTASSHDVRRLRWEAAVAVAHGLDRAAALRALTLDAARILGIDAEYGSIEAGKVANLVIATGDPLEPQTRIERVFIRGREVPLTSRQTELRDRFWPETR